MLRDSRGEIAKVIRVLQADSHGKAFFNKYSSRFVKYDSPIYFSQPHVCNS